MGDGRWILGCKWWGKTWERANGGKNEEKKRENWAKGDWVIVLGLEGMGLNKSWF